MALLRFLLCFIRFLEQWCVLCLELFAKTDVINVIGCRTGRSVNTLHVSLIAVLIPVHQSLPVNCQIQQLNFESHRSKWFEIRSSQTAGKLL